MKFALCSCMRISFLQVHLLNFTAFHVNQLEGLFRSGTHRDQPCLRVKNTFTKLINTSLVGSGVAFGDALTTRFYRGTENASLPYTSPRASRSRRDLGLSLRGGSK